MTTDVQEQIIETIDQSQKHYHNKPFRVVKKWVYKPLETEEESATSDKEINDLPFLVSIQSSDSFVCPGDLDVCTVSNFALKMDGRRRKIFTEAELLAKRREFVQREQSYDGVYCKIACSKSSLSLNHSEIEEEDEEILKLQYRLMKEIKYNIFLRKTKIEQIMKNGGKLHENGDVIQ